jgi:hypothetical protein
LGYPVSLQVGKKYDISVKWADIFHNCKDKTKISVHACINTTTCTKIGDYNGAGINDWAFATGSFTASVSNMHIRVRLENDLCCGCSNTCDANCSPLSQDINLYVDNIVLNAEGATDSFTHHPADTCGSGSLVKKCVDKGQSSCDDGIICTDNNCAATTGCQYNNNAYQEACYTGPANTVNVGTCTKGIKTCGGGAFGGCIGEVTPVVELCAAQGEDGLDNNCDGLVDNIGDFKTWYQDSDSDNHGKTAPTKNACDQPSGYASSNDDCDDADPKNYLGNTEVCDDQDNNCLSTIDENFSTKGNACDTILDNDLC